MKESVHPPPPSPPPRATASTRPPRPPADAPATDSAPAGLGARIAERVRALRQARGLSLDALAHRCGVSRSMISVIERGAGSPTAVVLERLSVGLGVSLATLFEAPPPAGLPQPLARRAGQATWRDPASGYRRRNVSPGRSVSPIQIVEVDFPAGAHIAYETDARQPVVHQQVWVLGGEIEVGVGEVLHRLAVGDCLAMRLDRPISYRNPTAAPARYAVVLVAEDGPWR